MKKQAGEENEGDALCRRAASLCPAKPQIRTEIAPFPHFGAKNVYTSRSDRPTNRGLKITLVVYC
jgi:hypothetical protein